MKIKNGFLNHSFKNRFFAKTSLCLFSAFLCAKPALGIEEFHKAVIEGDIQTVSRFLENGIDPDTKDDKGWAPLHLAALNQDMVDLLLKNGATATVTGPTGITPMFVAVVKEREDIKSLLENYGGRITPVDHAMITLLPNLLRQKQQGHSLRPTHQADRINGKKQEPKKWGSTT